MMRRIFLLLVLALPSLVAAGLTDEDRKYAIDQLDASRNVFLDSLKGLTKEQWNFKPAPDRWSIAECAEHVTISESLLFQYITDKLMKTKPVSRLGAINRQDDEELLKATRDRSKKSTAPQAYRPTGKWSTQKDLIFEFRKRRQGTIDYVRITGEDLRTHVEPNGPGRIRDAYQYLLLIAAHTERHAAQIEEIRQHPQFPASDKKNR